MTTKDLIAAIEIGSSKIAGMVGKKDPNGNLEVLAYATEDSTSFVRKGIIFNVDKAVAGLLSIITNLEQSVNGVTISKVYVSICGQSFRSLINTVAKDLPDNISVTEEIVDSICEENRALKFTDLEIYDVIPQGYHIGTIKEIDPIGVTGNHIEGTFLNIIGRSIILKNLRRCFLDAKIEIADDPDITPLIIGKYVLTESERRLGCALVDFGADTTTIAIYHKNILKFLVVIPIGGSSITSDLMSLNIDEYEAEELKVHYGSAILESNEEEEEIIHLNDEGHSVKLSEINNIVEARACEIIANVWNQIQLSGYATKLGSGLIFTGGGSNLRHLSNAFSRITKRNPKIRTASSIYEPAVTGLTIPSDGTINALIGMVLNGRESCCDQIFPPSSTPIAGPSTFNKDEDTEEGILTVDDNDANADQEERVNSNDIEDKKDIEDINERGKKTPRVSFWDKLKNFTKEEEKEDIKEDPDEIARRNYERQQQDIKREQERAEKEIQREIERERKMREKEKEDLRKAEQTKIVQELREKKKEQDLKRKEEEEKQKEENRIKREEKQKNNPLRKGLKGLTEIFFPDDPMEDDDN